MAQFPEFKFNYQHSAAEFTVPKQLYLATHPDAAFAYIATSVLVLDTTVASNPRVLLLQRAANDEDPEKWEPPGGACDDDDKSILHAAARELWEETGLRVTLFGGPIGEPHLFTLDDGKEVAQYNFIIYVGTGCATIPAVRLNPEEHQGFVWATEDEIKARKVDSIELEFTRGEVERTVLLAFDYLREN